MQILNTLTNIQSLISLFDKKDHIRLLKICIMLFFGVCFEILGLSLIAPVVSLLQGVVYLEGTLFSFLGFDINKFELKELLLIIVILIFIKNVIQYYSNYHQNSVGFFFQKKMSQKILKYYLNIDFKDYVNTNTADIINDIVKVVNTVCQYTILPLFYLITEVILITGVFVFLLYFDFKTTVIMGSFFSFSLIAYNLIVGRKINSLGNIVMQNDALKIKQITESILSYIQIKLGKSQNFFLDKFNHPNRKVSESLAVQFSLRQLPKYYFELLLYSFLLLLVMFYDDNGQNEFITKIGVYIASLLKAIPSLNRITGSIQSIKFSQSSIERLTSLNFNLNEDLNLAQLQLNEGLFLDHITFSYLPGENILQDLSISIPKNSALGIIGESGVGKSTLVNIMLGNLFPLSGSIKVDDIELTKNNTSSWQSKIGYVSQKIYLLDEPIVNNIAFGVSNDKIDINKVKEVMKLAKISSLEEKFDIINDNVGEDGSKLSGGQIQRLGLARALYTDPEILFFDEFTSALDDKTEQKILKDIEKLKDKKTIIIISHKKSILNFCDQILDMNK